MFRLFISFYLLISASIGVYVMSEPLIRTMLLKDMFEQSWTEEYAGVFFLLDELYTNIDPDAFSDVMERYPSNVNLPLSLIHIDDVDLPKERVEHFMSGESYVADILDPIVYSRVADSSWIARTGPVGLNAPLDRARIIYRLSLFAVLAFPVFIWVANLQKKTRKLEAAASRFGEGDLSIRVSEEGKYRVGHLNRTFNLMAERVERLISGHKTLTNAVAHELRTPVSRIRFQLDMLYAEKNDALRMEYMQGISEDIDELAEMVDELLTYARFDREPVAVSMNSHSLHQSIQNIINDRHFDSKLTVYYDESWFLSDQALQFTPFDPKHLERAIGNLITNAEKYAQSKIHIQIKKTPDSCNIMVDDDGPGIPAENREDIFEPFKRLDNSRTRSTGGYGLGLAIVRQIAQWHKGSVTVGEAPIGGARFVFSWPMSDQAVSLV